MVRGLPHPIDSSTAPTVRRRECRCHSGSPPTLHRDRGRRCPDVAGCSTGGPRCGCRPRPRSLPPSDSVCGATWRVRARRAPSRRQRQGTAHLPTRNRHRADVQAGPEEPDAPQHEQSGGCDVHDGERPSAGVERPAKTSEGAELFGHRRTERSAAARSGTMRHHPSAPLLADDEQRRPGPWCGG